MTCDPGDDLWPRGALWPFTWRWPLTSDPRATFDPPWPLTFDPGLTIDLWSLTKLQKSCRQERKQPPPMLVSHYIKAVPVRQHFPLNSMWLCFRREGMMRNKTLGMANKLGDIQETLRNLKCLFFSKEVNGCTISVCVHNFLAVWHQKFSVKGNCTRLRKKEWKKVEIENSYIQ